jgi:hypothetical protein
MKNGPSLTSSIVSTATSPSRIRQGNAPAGRNMSASSGHDVLTRAPIARTAYRGWKACSAGQAWVGDVGGLLRSRRRGRGTGVVVAVGRTSRTGEVGEPVPGGDGQVTADPGGTGGTGGLGGSPEAVQPSITPTDVSITGPTVVPSADAAAQAAQMGALLSDSHAARPGLGGAVASVSRCDASGLATIEDVTVAQRATGRCASAGCERLARWPELEERSGGGAGRLLRCRRRLPQLGPPLP